MKLKKILPLAISLSLMAGCSGKKQSATPTNEEIVTEIKNPVEITFWHAMNGDQEKSLQGLVDNFQKENPNIKVILQNQSSYPDLQQKITATTASPKDLPTMTQAYPDWLLNAIDENLVLDLKPYIENETLKFDNYDDIVKGFREASTLDGKIYGIPFNKSTEVLWYNKNLFDKLNLKVPKTYEEFKDVAEDIKEKANIVGGGFDSLSNYYTTYLKNEGVTFDSKLDPTSDKSEKAVDYYLDGVYEFLKFLTTKDNQITWATQTGYIPVRESAINSDEYKNTGSLIAPIIADATKNLFTNPLVKGMDSAYRESNTVLESVLAEKNPDVKSKLEAFKSTLMSIWE